MAPVWSQNSPGPIIVPVPPEPRPAENPTLNDINNNQEINQLKWSSLEVELNYVDKCLDKMNYADLIDQDLELGSGAVEVAIKNLIGKRCDHGGIRWIKERAEAVVQLRCIEANDDWEAFMTFVHDRLQAQAQQDGSRTRLQTK